MSRNSTGAARSQYQGFPVHEPACAAGDKYIAAVCTGGCHQKRFAVEHPPCPRTVLPRDDNSTVRASGDVEAVPGCNTPHRAFQLRTLKFLRHGARREGNPPRAMKMIRFTICSQVVFNYQILAKFTPVSISDAVKRAVQTFPIRNRSYTTCRIETGASW